MNPKLHTLYTYKADISMHNVHKTNVYLNFIRHRTPQTTFLVNFKEHLLTSRKRNCQQTNVFRTESTLPELINKNNSATKLQQNLNTSHEISNIFFPLQHFARPQHHLIPKLRKKTYQSISWWDFQPEFLKILYKTVCTKEKIKIHEKRGNNKAVLSLA